MYITLYNAYHSSLLSSNINDSGAVVLISKDMLNSLNFSPPFACIVSWAQCGLDSPIMGMGLVPAVNKVVSNTKNTQTQITYNK